MKWGGLIEVSSKNFEVYTAIMAGNACWPHRKQELTLHCKTIISQYYIHFSICRKKWGAKAPAAPPPLASLAQAASNTGKIVLKLKKNRCTFCQFKMVCNKKTSRKLTRMERINLHPGQNISHPDKLVSRPSKQHQIGHRTFFQAHSCTLNSGLPLIVKIL